MNYKKVTSLFLAVFLLFSNLGLSLTIHFCNDKLASVNVISFSSTTNLEKSCCCKVTEKKSKCCHNKVIKSQEKPDQIINKKFDFKFEFFVINQNNFSEFVIKSQIFNAQKSTFSSCFPNAPPLYKLYSQYIFYS